MKCFHQVAVDLRFRDEAGRTQRLGRLNEIRAFVNGKKDDPGRTTRGRSPEQFRSHAQAAAPIFCDIGSC
jgi:hypothetical protein